MENNKNAVVNKVCHSRGMLHILSYQKSVILNLIQDLQRLSLSLLNGMRGRFQIKFGMTALFNNNAFTLIELLVVVLIIGILAAVALPQYQKAVYKSRYAKLKPLVESIAIAQEIFFLEHGYYSEDIDELTIEFPTNTLEPEYDEEDIEADAKKKRNRYYNWGQCWTRASGEVSCVNDEISMQYKIFLQHAEQNAGKRLCILRGTFDSNNIRHKICQNETHSSQPIAGVGSYQYF